MKKILVGLLMVSVIACIVILVLQNRHIDVPVEFVEDSDEERIVIEREPDVASLTYDDIEMPEKIVVGGIDDVGDSGDTDDEIISEEGDAPMNELLDLHDEDSYKSFVGWAVTDELLEDDLVSLGSSSFQANYGSLLQGYPYDELAHASYDADFDIDMETQVVIVYANNKSYRFEFEVDSNGLVNSIVYLED